MTSQQPLSTILASATVNQSIADAFEDMSKVRSYLTGKLTFLLIQIPEIKDSIAQHGPDYKPNPLAPKLSVQLQTTEDSVNVTREHIAAAEEHEKAFREGVEKERNGGVEHLAEWVAKDGETWMKLNTDFNAKFFMVFKAGSPEDMTEILKRYVEAVRKFDPEMAERMRTWDKDAK